MPKEFSIPRLDYDELRRRADAIKPLVRSDVGVLNYIEEPSLSQVSFIWDPVVTDAAEGLEEVTRIVTLHTFGYAALFKPSIAEVLSQIPEDMLEQVKAFEIFGPATADDLNANLEELQESFHVAITILYR